MIWHLKTVKVDTPREADIGMEHLCSVGKCSIGFVNYKHLKGACVDK